MGAGAAAVVEGGQAPAAAPVAPAPEKEASLMPGKDKAAPAAKSAGEQAPAQSQVQYPEWLPDAFRRQRISESVSEELAKDGKPDFERIAEHVTKAWKDTSGKLREKNAFLGAPKADEKTGKVAYEIKVPEGIEAPIDPEDPLWSAAQEVFAELNLSQSAVDKILAPYVTIMARENVVNRENELRQLRLAGFSDAKLAELGQFWEAFVDTPEEFQAIQQLCTRHDGVLTFSRLRDRILAKRMLPEQGQPVSVDRKEEWRKRVVDPRNATDSAFQAETDSLAKQLFGE